MLALFRLGRRVIPYVIAAILLASFAACVIVTPIDPVAAFYLPWTRGWALALGALLAYREVFLLGALPYPRRASANIGAALGVALIVFGYFWLNEAQLFPGWRAAIPAAGCGLVIANPRSWIGETALGTGSRPSSGSFLPLYLWHWPLFAYAHIWPEIIPRPAVMLALSVAAVVLATLTYRYIEEPTKPLFRRRPYGLALALVVCWPRPASLGRSPISRKASPTGFPRW